MKEMLPPRRPRWLPFVDIPFLAIWVVLWAAALPERIEEDGIALAVFGYVVVVVLTALLLVLPLAWMLGGREQLEVTQDRLSLRKAMGPFGWTRAVEAARVAEVRTVPRRRSTFWQQSLFWDVGLTGGPIVVEVTDGPRLRFGGGVDDDRARELVARIREALR